VFTDAVVEKIVHPLKQNTLILGTAVNIERKSFAIFCRSLRKFNNITDIAVFVAFPVDQNIQKEAILSNITLIDADISDFGKDYLSKYHISSKRWLLYDRFLKSIKYTPQLLWIIDISDIVFQADPFGLFEAYDDRTLFLFRPAGGASLGTDERVSAVFKSCFGKLVLDQVRNKFLLSPRAVAGGFDAVQRIVSQISSILMAEQVLVKPPNDYLYSDFPQCEKFGADQVALNALIHLHVLQSNISVRINDFARNKAVYILDMTTPTIRTKSEQVFDLFDNLVPIIHNYQHDIILSKYILRTYISWVDAKDHKVEWESEPACKRYNFIENRDFFRNSCELIEVEALTPASCCSHCNAAKLIGDKPRQRSCNSFTFTEGKCYLKSCVQVPVGCSHDPIIFDFYFPPLIAFLLQKELDLVHHPKILRGETKSFDWLASGGISAYFLPVGG